MTSKLESNHGNSFSGYFSKLKTKIRNFLVYSIGAKILWKFEELIPKFSLIGNTEFFEPEHYPQFNWTKDLESNWQVMRSELDEILKHSHELPNLHDISTDQGNIVSKDELWKTYFLYAYGWKFGPNCQRCPETTRLIEKIPGMKTAFFSIMLPGKHIPEHRGPYKGVIRYLFALKVPEPREKCRIRVDKETRHWEEGKGLMFDDSFRHEAWNETDGIRVVLFIDIVRPMRFPLSLINNIFLQLIAWSPFVREGNKNQKQWDKRLEELFATK